MTTAADVPHNKNLKCWTRAVRDRGRSRRARGSGSFERPQARSRHRDRLSGKNQGQTAVPASKGLANLSVACLFSNRRALGLCREPGRCCCQYLAGRPGRVFSYGLTGAVCTIVRREIKENPAATNVSSFAERTFLVGGGVLRIYSNLDLGAEFHHLSCGHAEEGC